MNLLFRMIWVWMRAYWRPPLTPTDESVVSFRVLPNDLDVFMHMNNSRYLALMDLGRLDLILRNGIANNMRKKKWYPIVGVVQMRYRKSLNPLQGYRLKSRIVYWNDKWFYLEQQFIRGDTVCALAFVKGLIRGPEGNISTALILQEAGFPDHPKPTPPQQWRDWIESEEQVRT